MRAAAPALLKRTALVLGAMLAIGAGPARAETWVYWVNFTDDVLYRCPVADCQASTTEAIVTATGGDQLTGALAHDAAAGRLYFSVQSAGSTIESTDLEGQDRQSVASTAGAPGFAMAVDSAGTFLYWTQTLVGDRILRVALPGGPMSVLTLVQFNDATPTVVPRGIVIDEGGSPPKLYWLSFNGVDGIRRSDLLGTNIEAPVTNVTGGIERGIALDPGDRRLYYTAGGGILRASLPDFADVEQVVVPSSGIDGNVGLDLVARQVYWEAGSEIRRAPMDPPMGGSATFDVVTGFEVDDAPGLAIVEIAPDVPALPPAGPLLLGALLVASAGLLARRVARA